jgi:WD40 repeat protein
MPSPTADKEKRSTTKPRQMMRGHNMMVLDVALLRDGRHIITCSTDSSLRVWDLESGANIGEPWQDDGDEEDEAGVSTIALSPTGNTVASGSSDGTVRLWDVETGKVIIKLTGHDGIVWSVCWRADGERLVSGGHDGTIRLWDVTVEGGKIVLGPIETGHLHVYAVMYSPSTTKIVTGGRHWQDNAVKIWDAETGDLLSTIEHHYAVRSLAWTSDEKKLISGSNDGSIRIFGTNTWQQIAILQGHEEVVYAISLFQNDRLLASGSDDLTARLWNLDTNLPVGPPIEHEDEIRSAAISADGTLLLTGCEDNNAYVWDIHTTLKDAGLEDLLSILDVNTSSSVSSQH